MHPGSSDGKESACPTGDPGSISGLGRSLGEGNGYPLQYSCLENSKERGDWWVPQDHRVGQKWATNTHTQFESPRRDKILSGFQGLGVSSFSSFILIVEVFSQNLSPVVNCIPILWVRAMFEHACQHQGCFVTSFAWRWGSLEINSKHFKTTWDMGQWELVMIERWFSGLCRIFAQKIRAISYFYFTRRKKPRV